MLRKLRWWADLLDARFRIPAPSPLRDRSDALADPGPWRTGVARCSRCCCWFKACASACRKWCSGAWCGNALVDALIGAIPILGSVGDIFWRANTANLAVARAPRAPGRFRRPAATTSSCWDHGRYSGPARRRAGVSRVCGSSISCCIGSARSQHQPAPDRTRLARTSTQAPHCWSPTSTSTFPRR